MDLSLLQANFGADLVPLKHDAITRLGVVMGMEALPLGPNLVAADGRVDESRPAGVACGAKTGLLALACSSEMADKVLADNPLLAKALITGTQQVRVIWLRPLNGLPPNASLGGAQVIGSGLIPVMHPDPQLGCSIVQPGSPLSLNLNTLIFTGNLKAFFDEWLLRVEVGPPFIAVSTRRRKLNFAYWAIAISRATGLQFDDTRRVFVVRHPDQPDQTVEACEILRIVAAFLQRVNQAGAGISAQEICLATIKGIVAGVRMLCSFSSPGETEQLLKFMQAHLERKSGGMVTVNEVVACYQKSRVDRGLPRFPENRLRRNLKLAVAEEFGLRESHDIGKTKRGFRGLVLRSPGGDHRDVETEATEVSHPTPPDGPDGPDAPDRSSNLRYRGGAKPKAETQLES